MNFTSEFNPFPTQTLPPKKFEQIQSESGLEFSHREQ